jgi:hypothetical protein
MRITGDEGKEEEAFVEATTSGGLLVEVIRIAFVEFAPLYASNIPEGVSNCQTGGVL